MAGPTNFVSTTPSATGFGIPSGLGDDSFFLLQDGTSFLLLQNGVDKLILEAGHNPRINYTATSLNPTNFATPSNS